MWDLPCQKNLKKCWQSVHDEGLELKLFHRCCTFYHHHFTLNIRQVSYSHEHDFKNDTSGHCSCLDCKTVSDIPELDIDLRQCCLRTCALACEPSDSFIYTNHKHFHFLDTLGILYCYCFYFCNFCSETILSLLHMFKVWGKIYSIVTSSNIEMILNLKQALF